MAPKGTIAVALWTVVLVAAIVIPARKGASPGAKLSLISIALMGIGRGVGKMRDTKRQQQAYEKDGKGESGDT